MTNKKWLADLLLIGGLVIISAVCLLFFFNSNAQTVKITQNGEILAELPIGENREFTIENCLTVKIENGKVWVHSSACPDLVCENSGKISASGQSIICLPNKIIVELTGSTPETDIII